MKKKIMASLLIGSAVVGANLAPLSAQAVTTGNTPVQVEFGGGTLPDQDSNNGSTTDPDLESSNTNFDILAIPKRTAFETGKIGSDLSALKYSVGTYPDVYVGDLRGTKEGWHLTAEIQQMVNGTDTLSGDINFELINYYAEFRTAVNTEGIETGWYSLTSTLNGKNIANDATAPTAVGTNIKIGGGASTITSAGVGKGQGLWGVRFNKTTLNVTTPMQQLKKGAYTGTVTWNLVAGPSI
ncbi:WxL domain-containing protein [Enterococcus faecalis]|uniref:WxL domain-containing protein n=1 Tax=Enterococcus TaxID=1350 RepID=UPI002090339D|nr:WxL domain-containing protein [Enterococcus faecalis]MCO5447738.1 WxL domain-containing protein [Enterococcus faecalis]MEB6069753.1 WxL domain-containing protein [Enterococcus faecalis]MEB6189122.1 WxL domain-containing protein [Enterococcus faecalis]